MPTLLTLTGGDLTPSHHAQIDAAERREFGMGLSAPSTLADRLYFLLVEPESDTVLACGYLKPIHPVLFQGQTFSFLNIGGVIANEKGKGYGKQVMQAMRAHLLARDQTGLGYCWPHNTGFYEKCGFTVETNATHRFIYRDENGCPFTGAGQVILYLESSDRFMAQVLASPDAEVSVPDPGIW